MHERCPLVTGALLLVKRRCGTLTYLYTTSLSQLSMTREQCSIDVDSSLQVSIYIITQETHRQLLQTCVKEVN